jgi:hypothetical protein
MDEPGDFVLLGLVTNENDYRLSWQMNQKLGIELVRADNAQVKLKGMIHEFVQYVFFDENKFLQFTFVKNKSSHNAYLISEHKSCDYFLCIQGSMMNELDDVVRRLKEIQVISLVIKINALSLKSRKNLVFL